MEEATFKHYINGMLRVGEESL